MDTDRQVTAESERPQSKHKSSHPVLATLSAFLLLGLAIGGFVYSIHKNWLPWGDITEGQATVLASGITLVSAVIISTIGPLLFSNSIGSIAEATEEVDKLTRPMSKQLKDLEGKIKKLDEGIGELDRGIGAFSKRFSSMEQWQNEQILQDTDEGGAFVDLKEIWHGIQGCLEELAVNPDLTSNKRTRLWGVDRRSYREFIAKLIHYGQLDGVDEEASEALQLWLSYRNGRNEPLQSDLEKMEAYLYVIRKHLEGLGWTTNDGWAHM